ncbi:hypothetical protein [Parabacteroides distasonis]|uniref:Uncharacterized protein n=1 Tax=Parabacteroides distasonis TaxID=823 RepID=A0A5C6KQF3_PARDI|nr:hypothetical protein [Parabacteroides distasonis]TWV64058.1 hypothetical protein FSA05_00085 [Parabacteroides distasonis]
MGKASKIVNAAVLGKDFETVFVNGKAYIIHSPTIHKIAGAGYYLSDLKGETIGDMLRSLQDVGNAAYALSWFIQGDDSLFENLSKGTFDEVVEALSVAFSMISSENFCKLSILAKNVASLTAKQKR